MAGRKRKWIRRRGRVRRDRVGERKRRRKRRGREKKGYGWAKGRCRDFSTDREMWSSRHECRAYYWATHYPVIRPTGSAIIGNSLLRCLVEAVFNGLLNESRAGVHRRDDSALTRDLWIISSIVSRFIKTRRTSSSINASFPF